MTETPEKRAACIRGLRDLADFLESHPYLPMPVCVRVGPLVVGDDDQQRAAVDRIANVLGVEPVSNADDTHYEAERSFGPVAYEATAIRASRMAAYDALMSYRGAVQTSEAAS
ncbi:hypothetical protein [Actinomadura litoris]|uniref:hypothetical protein n=1 Tax=Actinomadura litoris TaxID=2678616 RepID=UPI001FA783C5|nr:hypothetical protein [Actinomadura litoris]